MKETCTYRCVSVFRVQLKKKQSFVEYCKLWGREYERAFTLEPSSDYL